MPSLCHTFISVRTSTLNKRTASNFNIIYFNFIHILFFLLLLLSRYILPNAISSAPAIPSTQTGIPYHTFQFPFCIINNGSDSREQDEMMMAVLVSSV